MSTDIKPDEALETYLNETMPLGQSEFGRITRKTIRDLLTEGWRARDKEVEYLVNVIEGMVALWESTGPAIQRAPRYMKAKELLLKYKITP